MTNEEMYRLWKRQRSSAKLPSGFAADLIRELQPARRLAKRSIRKSVVAVVAVVAASVIGVLRIAITLFLGIQAY
ncbi:MAG: hypothetical protein AAGJ40_04735 [Planctomycetota bacterium]